MAQAACRRADSADSGGGIVSANSSWVNSKIKVLPKYLPRCRRPNRVPRQRYETRKRQPCRRSALAQFAGSHSDPSSVIPATPSILPAKMAKELLAVESVRPECTNRIPTTRKPLAKRLPALRKSCHIMSSNLPSALVSGHVNGLVWVYRSASQ